MLLQNGEWPFNNRFFNWCGLIYLAISPPSIRTAFVRPTPASTVSFIFSETRACSSFVVYLFQLREADVALFEACRKGDPTCSVIQERLPADAEAVRNLYTHVYIYLFISIYLYLYIYIYIYIYVYICIYIYEGDPTCSVIQERLPADAKAVRNLYTHVYIYAYTYTYMYIYIYVYIWGRPNLLGDPGTAPSRQRGGAYYIYIYICVCVCVCVCA